MLGPDDAHIVQRLRDERIAWLATVTRGNRPHAVPVWFAWSDPRAVVFSLPTTRKVADLRRRAGCTLALESADGGNDNVIIDGRAALLPLDDSLVRELTPTFVAKYEGLMPAGFETWIEGFRQPIVIEADRITAWNKSSGELDFRTITRD